MREQDKERILVEVEHRLMDEYGRDSRKIENAIFDTIYHERQRLRGESDHKRARRDRAFYKRVYSRAAEGGADEQRGLLLEMVRHFSSEVVGHFDPRVYAIATRAVPPALTALLNTVSPIKLLEKLPEGLTSMGDQLVIEGEVDTLKRLIRRGTTILVSTHQSNLDSIVLGFALNRMGLPPFTYGAGLNLFSNKMIGFFMHNLGAYKVDRRKKAELYKDVLKNYAGCTMELGYNNMFFPGGTRSRSGSIEDHLKMGLLGMGLNAYTHNLAAGRKKPDIFVFPCTLNYQLVLEAETLIDDYLKEVGKSRYIITDDEFSKPRVVFEFVKKLFSLDSRIHLHVAEPLDVFGNPVDRMGRSLDGRGRVIDRKRYVFRDGEPSFDPQRDREYTRELGAAIVESFHRNAVINSTNLVNRAIFQWMWEDNPDSDLYKILRTGGRSESFSLTEAYRRVDRTLETVKKLAAKDRVRMGPTIRNKDTVFIMNEALAHLKAFHREPALVRRGDRLFHRDRNLIYFYQNRLNGFEIGDIERRR
jgi:glycerol-3-phosphate O-acyltransferase